mmetsp:Transcript_83222/g.199724  ORF Transcript_83222/g.199724 Transcript_83222/m.199724 type:complete len:335 (-) Transcript_83222:925-1929(-)
MGCQWSRGRRAGVSHCPVLRVLLRMASAVEDAGKASSQIYAGAADSPKGTGQAKAVQISPQACGGQGSAAGTQSRTTRRAQPATAGDAGPAAEPIFRVHQGPATAACATTAAPETAAGASAAWASSCKSSLAGRYAGVRSHRLLGPLPAHTGLDRSFWPDVARATAFAPRELEGHRGRGAQAGAAAEGLQRTQATQDAAADEQDVFCNPKRSSGGGAPAAPAKHSAQEQPTPTSSKAAALEVFGAAEHGEIRRRVESEQGAASSRCGGRASRSLRVSPAPCWGQPQAGCPQASAAGLAVLHSVEGADGAEAHRWYCATAAAAAGPPARPQTSGG